MVSAVPVYNPLLLSRDEALALYVARQPLLERMVEDLQVPRPSNKLILGVRGMGKTTLLQRLRYAIEDARDLRSRWIPLTFPEEQYDVVRLSDFFLNCLDSLSDSLELRGLHDEAMRVDARVKAFEAAPAPNLAEVVVSALLEEAKTLGCGLLLLVDNAERILDDIPEADQWNLRKLLESDSKLVLVGATTEPSHSCYDYGRAFYDFFLLQDLNPLNEDEACEVLRSLAARHGIEERIRDWIDQDRARLRTMLTLTGGNPRTVVMLFGLLSQGTDGDVRSELERLLDVCTPLYKARFEGFPKQAQQIVDALAQHWHPITSADLAELTRLDHGIISSQLSRFARQGIVQKVDYFPESKTAFQIAERFFNIWYLMRASRRVRAKLRWLVEFLRLFYSQQDLQEDARRRLRLMSGRTYGGRGLEDAFSLAEVLDHRPLRAALERQAMRGLIDEGASRESLREMLDFEGADAPLLTVAERFEALNEARKLAIEAKGEDFWKLFGGSIALSAAEKRAIARRLKDWKPDVLAALEAGLTDDYRECCQDDEALTEFTWQALREGLADSVDDAEGMAAAAEALGHKQLSTVMERGWGKQRRLTAWVERSDSAEQCAAYARILMGARRLTEAERACRRAIELGPTGAETWAILGDCLDAGRRFEDAGGCYRKATMLEPTNATSWRKLARVAQWDLHDFAEAELAYRRAIELEGDDVETLARLGFLLYGCLGRYEEAASLFRRAVAIEPKSAVEWAVRAEVFRGFLDDPDGAQKAARKAVDLDPTEELLWCILGSCANDRGEYVEAESHFRRALAINDQYPLAWCTLGGIQWVLGRNQDAEVAYRKTLELDPTEISALVNLGKLLSALGRLDEANALLESAVDRAPASMDFRLELAICRSKRGKWTEAFADMRRVISEAPARILDQNWNRLLVFFTLAVQHDQAIDCLRLLDETAVGERWAPLREALAAIAAGDPAYLRRVAPEVRSPAEAILKQLAPELTSHSKKRKAKPRRR